jgi:hypothetical protein
MAVQLGQNKPDSVVVRRTTASWPGWPCQGAGTTRPPPPYADHRTRSGRLELFCPLTGRKVFTEDGQANALTLCGGWCDKLPDQLVHLTGELKPLWQAYLKTLRAEEDLLDIPAFLRSVELPNWVAFEQRDPSGCLQAG